MTGISPETGIHYYRKSQPLYYVLGAVALVLGIVLTIYALVQHTTNSTQFNLQIVMMVTAMAIVAIGGVLLFLGYYWGVKADTIEIESGKGSEASRPQPSRVASSSGAGLWFCQDCGRENPSGADFCGGCGKKKR